MIPKIINFQIKIVRGIWWFIISFIYTFSCDLRGEKGQASILRSLIAILLLWVLYCVKIDYTPLSPVVKYYSDNEAKIYFLQHENYRLEQENKKLKEMQIGLKEGKVEAVKNYLQVTFKDEWKMAFATIQGENKDEDGYFKCGVVQDWLNDNGTIDYGLAQINTVHLWMVNNQPERLLDCKTNIDVMYRVWDRADGLEGNNKGEWTPWVAYNDKRAEQFYKLL